MPAKSTRTSFGPWSNSMPGDIRSRGWLPPCRHIGCVRRGAGVCISAGRRTRARVDLDAVDALLLRWEAHLTADELSAGRALVHALVRLDRTVPGGRP